MTSLDSFRCCKTLKVGSKSYAYFSLPVAERNGLKGISRLPFSMKVLLENLLRNEDGRTVTKDDIKAFAEWLKTKTSDHEFAFRPARVLMQDFTGVPAVVDLAAMRDAMKALGGDPKKINPQVPVDLVIDHSVAVAPSSIAPVSLKPTTCGMSIEIGWPSIAASASIPPTPHPITPRPFTIVVCESVPTSVSGK
jgi:aconitase A